MTETLSWLDNEVQHCRVNADMTSARVAKVKTQIQRVAIEDTTKELGILDFERLKITVDKGEASLNMINRKFFLIKVSTWLLWQRLTQKCHTLMRRGCSQMNNGCREPMVMRSKFYA